MGKPTGFMEIERQERKYQDIQGRITHFNEFVIELGENELRRQGARCMDCGIPYCQAGCPVNNIIPDWNDLVYRGDWKRASEVLHSTNNFPEFTGRICPAPCEASCTLNIEDRPVTIKTIEQSIAERAWGRRMDTTPHSGPPNRQICGRDRLRSGRPCLFPATGQSGALGFIVRKAGTQRWIAALWHPGFQTGQRGDRPPHGTNENRGREIPFRYPCRCRYSGFIPVRDF